MTVTYAKTDPATNHLLDFIAGGVPTNKSGESAGNYNAVFGKINATDPLHMKTLTGIYTMQDSMLKQNGISTATGRYQGLKGTIQEYQNRKHLPNNTMFTQQLQDDFGLQKMIDRGYQSWWKKTISDDQFMNKLSCEWASLPDPYNGGKSHYDGDSAGNHASCSLTSFRECLKEARNYINNPDLETPEPEPPPDWVTITDPDQGIRSIQEVLVKTGDLPNMDEVDGDWGPKSEAALNSLVNRDKK